MSPAEPATVFGSDWPVCNVAASLGEWVRALDEIIAARSRENQERLYHRNARRIYTLDGRKAEASRR